MVKHQKVKSFCRRCRITDGVGKGKGATNGKAPKGKEPFVGAVELQMQIQIQIQIQIQKELLSVL